MREKTFFKYPFFFFHFKYLFNANHSFFFLLREKHKNPYIKKNVYMFLRDLYGNSKHGEFEKKNK